MRVGLALPPGDELPWAVAAERVGLFGVLARSVLAAAAVAAQTSTVRVVVRVPLGDEHPVTLAEELAVLDLIAGGRVVVLVDTEDLDAEAAAEDVGLLRRCWASRPVRHAGSRWRVPAGLAGHQAPESVMVTPKPAQVDLPVWLTGAVGPAVAASTGLPLLAERASDCQVEPLVQPALADMSGGASADRDLAVTWAAAGATHLLARLPVAGEPAATLAELARLVVPEVAMPGFPRIIAESPLPALWPYPIEGVQ